MNKEYGLSMDFGIFNEGMYWKTKGVQVHKPKFFGVDPRYYGGVDPLDPLEPESKMQELSESLFKTKTIKLNQNV